MHCGHRRVNFTEIWDKVTPVCISLWSKIFHCNQNDEDLYMLKLMHAYSTGVTFLANSLLTEFTTKEPHFHLSSCNYISTTYNYTKSRSHMFPSPPFRDYQVTEFPLGLTDLTWTLASFCTHSTNLSFPKSMPDSQWKETMWNQTKSSISNTSCFIKVSKWLKVF